MALVTWQPEQLADFYNDSTCDFPEDILIEGIITI
jgi:hypothetical protein